MRVLVVSCGGIAAERPLHWLVAAGHEVCLVGDHDFLQGSHPKNYQFFPAMLSPEAETSSEVTLDVHALEARMCTELPPRLREIAAEFQPDVVHVNAIGWHAKSCAIAGLRPLVVSAWGFLNFLLNQRPEEQSESNKFILKHTDVLIVENPKLVQPVKPHLSPESEIALLPLGVDMIRFRRDSARLVAKWKQQFLNLPPGTFVFLSPRGLGRNYGQPDIMQAYALAYPHFQQPTAMVFGSMGRSIGQDVKETYETVCKQAEDANLTDQVVWLDHFPHFWMSKMYNVADAIVNYPKSDAFPSTLLEAAACECMIISSDLPAYRETFLEQCCTFVPAQDPRALADTMIQMANQSQAERQIKGAEIRQQVIEQFDETIWKRRFVETLERVAASSKRIPSLA